MNENFNVSRTLTDGKLNRQNTNASKKLGAPPTIFEAIVFEIFYDPYSLTNNQKEELKRIVSNPEHIDWMAQNSILARITTAGLNHTDTSLTLLFPFFQSHISFPLQVGEKVLVIYDDILVNGTSLGRWITRPAEPSTVEDVNFTHSDRKLDPINNSATLNIAEDNRRNLAGPSATIYNERPNFPNGAGYNGATTLVQARSSQSDTVNPFDSIYNSKTSKQHTYEPVPRWVKRPQEFVLQGMNNTLIMLGQDRVGPAKREENSKEKINYAGTIDVVVGRGRYPLSENDNTAINEKQTSTLVVKNSRGNLETDKTPFIRRRNKNPKEGDTNFTSDASRIYITMNSEADTHFKLKAGNEGIVYPDKTISVELPVAPSETVGTAYIVQKTDHHRIIARKATNPDIRGTILLLKEGTKDQDLAYMYISKSGRTQIEAPQIFLGKATNGNQEPSLNNPEAGSQPYIKYQEYKQTIEHLQSQIDILKNYIDTAIGNIIFTGMNTSVSIPFAPIATLVVAANAVKPATVNMVAQITQKSNETPQKILNCRSKKIFGE